MAIELTIAGSSFQYPESKDPAGWGEEATSWAKAVTDTIDGLTSEADIPITTAALNNNILVPTSIIGLVFNSAVTRGATIEYVAYRNSGSIITPKAEKGRLELSFDGTDWTMARGMATTDCGITLSITSTGQIQYTSSNADPGNIGDYTGQIKFRASVLIQA